MTVSLGPLDRQAMVITGASSGVGLATAERGAGLVLAARSTRVLDEVVRETESSGGQALAVTCDVAVRARVERVARAAVERFGRIDTWVNNAGIAVYGWLDEVGDPDSRRMFDVNFRGVVNGSLAAIPHLAASGGGALINVGS